MPSHIAVTPSSQSFLNQPILFPVKILTPLIVMIYLVKRTVLTVFGYLLSLGVFSNGKYQQSWLNRFIINLYKGGCYDTHNRSRFDPDRLKQAHTSLVNIGGIPTETITKDGYVLDSMLIRYQDAKELIKNHGGKIVRSFGVDNITPKKTGKEFHLECKEDPKSKDKFIDLIIPDKTKPDSGWEKFSKDTLSKLGMETLTLTMEDGQIVKGYVVNHWEKENPTRPKKGLKFVRACAPTENYPMSKRDIMRRVLGLKGDVYCFDYRRDPTEGGYYLDLEAAIEKARKEYNFDLKRTVIDGFCLGGSIAIHGKIKYHNDGINLFTQNAFCCLKHTLKQQVFPANYLAPLARKELQSRDPMVAYHLRDNPQDCFNNEAKLSSPPSKKGITMIINTDTDTTIDPKSHERLVESAKKSSKKCFEYMFKGEPGKNGHSFDVLSDPKAWRWFVEKVASIDHPELTG